ncbi:hypothetical protein [Dyella sp. Tek66A03]|uniref:hypothetical protein n=1 Tax=Dyella sp. Tek66A03 TaxID=3458298 RepID=UPI00403EDDB4
MTNGFAIALLFLCSMLAAFFAARNSRTEQKNAELLRKTGELKAPRWPVVIFLMLALVASFMAIVTDHPGARGPTWPMSLFGLGGTVFVLVRSFTGVRLEPAGMRFGWRYRNYVAYSEMAQLELMSTARSIVLSVMVRYRGKETVGADLACTRLLVEELQKRSGCEITYRDYRGRVTQAPQWWGKL